MLKTSYQQARRTLILVVGLSVLLVGVVMLVTPGPAMLVIPAGFAILATAFLWARRLLKRLMGQAAQRPAPVPDDPVGQVCCASMALT